MSLFGKSIFDTPVGLGASASSFYSGGAIQQAPVNPGIPQAPLMAVSMVRPISETLSSTIPVTMAGTASRAVQTLPPAMREGPIGTKDLRLGFQPGGQTGAAGGGLGFGGNRLLGPPESKPFLTSVFQ